MNNIISNSVKVILLILLQVLVFNHINFLGYIDPYPYVMLILFLPIRYEQWQILILSFLIGLGIDLFQDTGGVHAGACLLMGYVRPFFLSTAFGISYDYKTLDILKAPFRENILYISLMVLVHHFMLFILVFFSFSHLLLILKNTVFSGIFTILVIGILVVLFYQNRRD